MNGVLRFLPALLSLPVLLGACQQPLPASQPQANARMRAQPASSGVSAADGSIVLGMSAAFSGPSKGLGIELYRGSMAYVEHVNASGGVNGRKIMVKAYDDGYNPTPAIENTIRLIEQDNAFLLFDYVGTPTVTRVLPLLKKYSERNAYLFFPFTGAQPHREPPYDEFVFNLRASYRQETEGLVENFVATGRQRIAVFYQADAYGRSGWDGVTRALTKRGLSLASEATYRRGTPYSQNLRQQVDILRATNPDAVVAIGSYAACAAFIRDARDAGWNVPIANVSFVGSGSLLDLLLEAGKARGKDYTANLINSEVVPSYDEVNLPAVSEYRALMDRYNPVPPAELMKESYEPLRYSAVSLEGYFNARVLAGIIRRMGDTPERAGIRKAVEGLDHLDAGVPESVEFGPNRHQGWDGVYYGAVGDGRWAPLHDWRQLTP